jgi:molybdate transport system substrate-binding protein
MSLARRSFAGRITALACAASLSSAGALAWAADVKVAVAANFAAPVKVLADEFRRSTGHSVQVSLGSTGKLYAQISNGAPFEALLSADVASVEKLEVAGLAVAGTRFTYAIGRLVLWSSQPGVVDPAGQVLKSGSFKHLAIANPQLAPYGAAAVQTLRSLSLHDKLVPRLVLGESITQAHQYVASGNAELGFVALSQVSEDGRIAGGSSWLVPQGLHSPIRQDAVLLSRGRESVAARAWLDFLKSGAARDTIRRHGYEVPTE